jgi:hypothetical protein
MKIKEMVEQERKKEADKRTTVMTKMVKVYDALYESIKDIVEISGVNVRWDPPEASGAADHAGSVSISVATENLVIHCEDLEYLAVLMSTSLIGVQLSTPTSVRGDLKPMTALVAEWAGKSLVIKQLREENKE